MRPDATFLNDTDVLDLVAEIYAAIGTHKHLPHVVWSRRYVAKIGSANFNRWEIKLSAPLMQRAAIEERKNTIAHEVCHLLVFARAHRHGVRFQTHGQEWQDAMYRCGYEPTRTHTVNNIGLVTRWEAHCSCRGRTHQLSTVLANKIRRGNRRVCLKCRQQVFLAGMRRNREGGPAEGAPDARCANGEEDQ